MQRASYRRNFTPAQPDNPATSLRDFVSGAYTLRTANEAAARDPGQVLAALTRNNASFTERELDRYLAKHLGAGPDGTLDGAAARDIAAAKAAVLGHREVLALHDRDTGEAAGRFSTRTVRGQERAALRDGARVAATSPTCCGPAWSRCACHRTPRPTSPRFGGSATLSCGSPGC